MYPEAPVTRQRTGDDMLSSVTRPAGAIMSAGAARPAPSGPRVESIWTFLPVGVSAAPDPGAYVRPRPIETQTVQIGAI